MSRSTKRPYIVDSAFKKFGKKMASRKVRRSSDVNNGCHYKRFYEQYDICEYKWYDPNNKKAYRK